MDNICVLLHCIFYNESWLVLNQAKPCGVITLFLCQRSATPTRTITDHKSGQKERERERERVGICVRSQLSIREGGRGESAVVGTSLRA